MSSDVEAESYKGEEGYSNREDPGKEFHRCEWHDYGGGNGFLVYLAKYCRVWEGGVSRWVAMGRRSGDLYPRKLEVGDISRDLLQNVESH